MFVELAVDTSTRANSVVLIKGRVGATRGAVAYLWDGSDVHCEIFGYCLLC